MLHRLILILVLFLFSSGCKTPNKATDATRPNLGGDKGETLNHTGKVIVKQVGNTIYILRHDHTQTKILP